MASFNLRKKFLEVLKRFVEDQEKKDLAAHAEVLPVAVPEQIPECMQAEPDLALDAPAPQEPQAVQSEQPLEKSLQAPLRANLDSHATISSRILNNNTEIEDTVLVSSWQTYRQEKSLENSLFALSPDEAAMSVSTPTEESFKKAAENPHTSSSTLSWLGNHYNAEVRLSVSRHANTPAETLAKLATDKDIHIRTAVAAHKNASRELLEKMCEDESKLVSGQARATLTMREHAAADGAAPDPVTRAELTFEALKRSPLSVSPSISSSVTAPAAPAMPLVPAVPAQIPQVSPPSAADITKQQAVTTPDLKAQKFGTTSNQIVASYTDLDAIKIEPINDLNLSPAAESHDLPGNDVPPPTTPSAWNTLESKSAKSAYVQQKDTVKDFKFAHTPQASGTHSRLPAAFAASLNDQAPDSIAFLTMLATRSGTPSMRLTELAEHRDVGIRMAVAENINTPKEAFLILARDKDARVKLRIIDNQNCPVDVIDNLRADADPYVAFEAKNALKRMRQFGRDIELDLGNSNRYV